MTSVTRRPRVFLAHHDPLFLRRLIRALDAGEHADIVGYTCDGSDAVDAAMSLRPDVVVIATQMPGLTGAKVARRIRAALPLSAVLLTSPDWIEDRAEVQGTGAAGFLREDENAPELIATMVALASVMAQLDRSHVVHDLGN